MILYTEHPSPLGTRLLAASAGGLCGAYFEPHNHFAGPGGWHKVQLADAGAGADTSADAAYGPQLAILREAARQLDEYFARQRRVFDLPLAPRGTPFQSEVWQGLRRIPFGQTWHYARLAEEIARPRAVRAVGAANARNPLSIIVPCHRVIGRDGTLVGYAGGLERKQFLLALEHGEQAELFA